MRRSMNVESAGSNRSWFVGTRDPNVVAAMIQGMSALQLLALYQGSRTIVCRAKIRSPRNLSRRRQRRIANLGSLRSSSKSQIDSSARAGMS